MSGQHARCAVIDNETLARANRPGHLARAALDAYNSEAAGPDHPIVRLAARFPDRLVLCPRQGGVNQTAFRRVHQMLMENLDRLMNGEGPERVVNGL